MGVGERGRRRGGKQSQSQVSTRQPLENEGSHQISPGLRDCIPGGEVRGRAVRERQAARTELEGDSRKPSVGGGGVGDPPSPQGSSLPELWIKVAQSISF